MDLFNFFGLGKDKRQKSNYGIDETMQTTQIGEDKSVLGAEYRYNIPVLRDYLLTNPNSAFARYMLAELLLDQGDLRHAKKEFMLGQNLEKEFGEQELTKDERQLKKKAKAKLEKALGHKL